MSEGISVCGWALRRLSGGQVPALTQPQTPPPVQGCPAATPMLLGLVPGSAPLALRYSSSTALLPLL